MPQPPNPQPGNTAQLYREQGAARTPTAAPWNYDKVGAASLLDQTTEPERLLIPADMVQNIQGKPAKQPSLVQRLLTKAVGAGFKKSVLTALRGAVGLSSSKGTIALLLGVGLPALGWGGWQHYKATRLENKLISQELEVLRQTVELLPKQLEIIESAEAETETIIKTVEKKVIEVREVQGECLAQPLPDELGNTLNSLWLATGKNRSSRP